MPTEPATPTLAEIVHRAAQICDPVAEDDGVVQFLIRFEDRDEPIAGLRDTIEEQVAEALGALDPDGDEPALQMAGAIVTYLAFRRDEASDNRADVLRLAAEAEYQGDPPENVADWLADQGVEV